MKPAREQRTSKLSRRISRLSSPFICIESQQNAQQWLVTQHRKARRRHTRPTISQHSRPATGHGARDGSYRVVLTAGAPAPGVGWSQRFLPYRGLLPHMFPHWVNSNGAWRTRYSGWSRLCCPPSRDHNRRRRRLRMSTTLWRHPPVR